MKKVILISCASKKLRTRAKAESLYVSPLFKFNLAYARKLNPDAVYILSAKYGLLGLDQVIQPYEAALNDMSTSKIRHWAHKVIKQMKRKIDLKNDKVIFLAGENYRRFLIPYLRNIQIPLKGRTIGKQLRFLKKALAHE